MTRRLALTTVAVLLLLGSAHAQDAWPSADQLARNWPVFRGSGVGVVSANLPTDWDGPSGKNILWKTPIPLPGKNSPIVWEGSIFLSGADQRRQEVYCIDAATGAVKWSKIVGTPDPEKAPKIMEDTSFAASTMTTDGRRVFAIFATGDLFALDFAGTILWKKSYGPLDNQYGHATSLAMWRNRLIVQLDQGLEAESAKSELIALDAASGDVVWKTPRPVPNSWASPIVVATPSGDQIITTADPFAIAYDPAMGKEIWRAKALRGDIASSPAYADGLVVIATEDSTLSAIQTGGSGDVTKTHIKWSSDTTLPEIVSPVLTSKYAINVATYGTVLCYDAKTGKKLWEHEFDGPFHASPIVVNDVVYLIDRKGIMQRFAAAEEFKLLGTSALGEPASATPAIAGNHFYLRGETSLFCVGMK